MTGALVAAGASCALTFTYMLVRELVRWPRKERFVSTLWIPLAFAGWILAALAVGLYMGERHRRIDAYLEVGRRTTPHEAVLRSSEDAELRATEAQIKSERKALAEGIRQAARAQGQRVTKAEVDADVDQIMEQVEASKAGM